MNALIRQSVLVRGRRRRNQYRSAWDVLHPGRRFAEKLGENPIEPEKYMQTTMMKAMTTTPTEYPKARTSFAKMFPVRPKERFAELHMRQNLPSLRTLNRVGKPP